jgi:two-component system, response regulator
MLDLNMPGMDGRETLLRIKENQDIRHIPVIVFTTSGNETDIQKCYEAGANCFVQKPFSYDRLVEVVRSIMQHWFDMALLPR